MVFDREYIKGKIDPNLTKFDGIKLAKYISDTYVTHNHYDLSLEIADTTFFKKYSSKLPSKILLWEEAQVVYEEIRKELIDVNNIILSNKKLHKPVLIKILKGLVRHMCTLNRDSPDHFRFGIDKWRGGQLETQLDKLHTTFEVINTIEKNLDKPDVGGFKYKYWNNMMSDLWACAYTGLYDEVLYLINVLEKLIIKITEGEITNPVFPYVLDQGTNARFLMSLYMLRSKIYTIQGKTDLAVNDYESIISFSKFGKTQNKLYKIWWFTGMNRVTEAAIEVYKLDPTPEHKQRCIDLYLHCPEYSLFDNTESTRERGLITYMLMKHVLDIEVK